MAKYYRFLENILIVLFVNARENRYIYLNTFILILQ